MTRLYPKRQATIKKVFMPKKLKAKAISVWLPIKISAYSPFGKRSRYEMEQERFRIGYTHRKKTEGGR